MPYADPAKQKEAQARWYKEKYQTDKDFKEQESKRKAKWLQTEAGKEKNAKASARFRREEMKRAWAVYRETKKQAA